MMIVRNVFLLLLFQGFCLCLFAQDVKLKEGEMAYASEDYAKAIEIYEDVLMNYGDSYEVYYNLGNAYYKLGKIAPAILNYERALLLNPGDDDIRFNLEMAKLKGVDKIEPLGELFLMKWFRSVQNMFSVDTWGAIGITCFILFIGCLVIFFFSKWMRLKKIGFYVGCILLVMVVFANVFAYNQKKSLINRNSGIVIAPTVTVKSSPDTSGTDLFVLHEGTKVFVRSSLGEWSEIVLEDGNIGWIEQENIEKI